MLDLYAFYAVAAITVVSALFVFIERKLMHAVVALSSAFFGSALLFFLLGQTMIALLQLLVFVGGLSTYLTVAIAAEEKKARMIRLPVFFAAAAAISAGMWLLLSGYLPQTASNAGTSFLSASASALQYSYPVFYVIAVLLFGATISGVMILKRLGRLVV